ncbi:MAG: tRNA pseudouridine synthase tRNA pseudouridine55 synthase [Candidatus Parcubacteria bacterium]|jgi:tRNA pseudouridine(55) synthase
MNIPKEGMSYSDLDMKHVEEGYLSIYKKVGCTPLQVQEEIQAQIDVSSTMTYVGRLDPMAEGWFDIVFNGDMTLKEKLMAKDKTYEIDILFGFNTDTGDILGKVVEKGKGDISPVTLRAILPSYVGKFIWNYPAYSSPMLGKKEGDIIKQKEIEIYSIDFLKERIISAQDLLGEITEKLSLSKMTGDFRLDEVQGAWQEKLETLTGSFVVVTIKVHCSSGAYMRTLAEKLGQELSTTALAFAIKRV